MGEGAKGPEAEARRIFKPTDALNGAPVNAKL
jgi:hypothetical protein